MSYIAIDIGGTNVRYAFADELDTGLLNYRKKPFLKTGNPRSEVEENICGVINMMSGDVKGIGISLAAVMNRNTGKVKTWPNNPCWNHYKLVEHLCGKYNVPIVIEDDANCGAAGEYHSFAAPIKNMAYITIGTGIGCGLILNGSLFTGENGFAGELGHVHLGNGDDESVCSCGNKGCFQSIASGPSVLKEYNTAAKAELKSLEQVYGQSVQNNPVAAQCLSNLINNVSIIIYNLTMCLDISVFVIGGGVSNMGAEFLLQIEDKVNERLSRFEREGCVKQAHHGEFSGVYGALRLLKNRIYIEKG